MEKGFDGAEETECVIQSKDGEKIPVLRKSRVMKSEAGEIQGVVETFTDLRVLKRLEREVTNLRRLSASKRGIGRLIGKNRLMQQVYDNIRLASDSEATILLLGETGTGKELAAEAIHLESRRKNGPLVKVNCSALSENLLESELFGHVRGAFTGAVKDKVGRFEMADGGTIFLDEIGDISPLIQVKLLRVLQEKEIERVGESVSRKINVRIIAATHQDLRTLVSEGKFREDLFYRLRVFSMTMPPLRERKEDIPLLVDSFIARFRAETGKEITGVVPDVNYCFMDYCWPGNVRELENAIEHAFVTCREKQIGLFDIPIEIRKVEMRSLECRRGDTQEKGGPYPQRLKAETREELIETLKACGWNKAEAARRLGVTRTTVWRKMKAWNIPLEPS
jgi:transcriptional regulator with PAS, ATPase and Fis domain